MRRRLASVFSLVVATGVAAALIGAGGCQQKAGERCQTDTDCQSPLICSKGDICVSNASVDGGVNPPDAGDGGLPDAAADAKPADAMVDAAVDAM